VLILTTPRPYNATEIKCPAVGVARKDDHRPKKRMIDVDILLGPNRNVLGVDQPGDGRQEQDALGFHGVKNITVRQAGYGGGTKRTASVCGEVGVEILASIQHTISVGRLLTVLSLTMPFRWNL
jgi:hypothetical protein